MAQSKPNLGYTIFIQSNKGDEWTVLTEVDTKDQMEMYVIDMNDRNDGADYPRYSMRQNEA
jgi:hypothetical protein